MCLVSVQSWPEVDDHVDVVWKYPEETDPEDTSRTIYGGVCKDGGRPVGATGLYLSREMAEEGGVLDGVIDVGAKGTVGKVELEYAAATSPDLPIVKIST